jgi:hypothetical protein
MQALCVRGPRVRLLQRARGRPGTMAQATWRRAVRCGDEAEHEEQSRFTGVENGGNDKRYDNGSTL